ncbi:NUDIX domain-containing protein [Yoonia sp. 2307UL14-13]|uniref:NUDIX domain-containing protein n=1 Tax=Yoonia sp. 2307UL14-13 TaxID=3126506 RepID=UPI0030AD8927
MDLFVYGTLRCHALMAAVAGSPDLYSQTAVLHDFAVVPVKNDVVPFVVPWQGATARGTLWRDLTAQQIARLTAYEGAFGYRLDDVTIQTDEGHVEAACFLPPDGIASGEGEWSLTDWEAAHLAPAILAADELFAHRPLPDDAALRRMWPMIENRAWAKHRAQAAPATVRHKAAENDFRIVAGHPPQGAFYRLQSLDVTHRRFDGERSHVLVREAFFAVDAALVLPYDPKRDKVALVEQARMGPAARRDPNPWMLEPIAGIVDARETPQDAAHREAKEEAGLDLRHLEPAAQYYPSPGASTDYFYAFVGLCDLPGSRPYTGGLPEEAEDLRIHPMPLSQAMQLAESGEIATGPLLHLLYWLALNKDRLAAIP